MTLFSADATAPSRSWRLFACLGPTLASVALLAACAQPSQSPNASTMNPPPAQTAPARDPALVLPAYEWDLVTARNARGQNDARWRIAERPPLRLTFKDGRIAVHNLCNMVGAGYSMDGNQLRVSRAMATMRACSEPGLMALEQRVAQQLPTAQAVDVRQAAQPGAAPQLSLRFADGSAWEMAGKPTPETRYGSAGERVFLEVAPQKVACNHPLMRNATCLRVRDVTYAESGVKTRVGDWRVFYGGIEGYEHHPGVRNILRVKRYSLARNGQLPADGPSHAYVLDLVVESETVR